MGYPRPLHSALGRGLISGSPLFEFQLSYVHLSCPYQDTLGAEGTGEETSYLDCIVDFECSNQSTWSKWS